MAKLTLRKWANTLIGMFVQGGASAAVSTFGLAGAHAVGVPVQPLDLKQVCGIFLAGAVIRTMRFLERSPVPEFGDEAGQANAGDTETINKQ